MAVQLDEETLTGLGLEDPTEPFPDVHALFQHYNELYFNNALGACSVEWSSNRMTLCAGVCHYMPGGGCKIKLSEPLLKLRPVRDLKETLLHEMIHAFLFLEGIRDRGDHGPRFQERMNYINKARVPDWQRPPSGYNVTIYHTMHDEVNSYRTHWWECDRCANVVKRAMNRPPQEADCRGRMGRGPNCRDTNCLWHMHLRHCGGTYVKIRSPEVPPAKRTTSGDGKQAAAGGSSGAAADASAGAAGPSTSAPAGSRAPKRRPPSGPSAGTSAGPNVRPIESYFGKGAGGVKGPAPSQAPDRPQQPAVSVPDIGTLPHGQKGPAVVVQQSAAAGVEGAMDAEHRRGQCAVAALARLSKAPGAAQDATAPAAPSGATDRAPPLQRYTPFSSSDRPPSGAEARAAATGGASTAAALRAVPAAAGAARAVPPARQPSGAPGLGVETIDLLGDDDGDEGDYTITTHAVAGSRPQQHMVAGNAQAGSSSGGRPGPGQPRGAAQPQIAGPGAGSGAQQLVTCPVCAAQWPAGTISNTDLNAHLDACLVLL